MYRLDITDPIDFAHYELENESFDPELFKQACINKDVYKGRVVNAKQGSNTKVEITPEMAADMIRMTQEGVPQRVIAERLGLKKPFVQKWVKQNHLAVKVRPFR